VFSGNYLDCAGLGDPGGSGQQPADRELSDRASCFALRFSLSVSYAIIVPEIVLRHDIN